MAHGKILTLGVSILVAWSALTVGLAQAATLRVPTEFSTIGSALNAARAGDRVEVQPGLYQETGLYLKAGVLLAGVDEDPSRTVIDGQGHARILMACEPGPTSRINRITFQNGWARGKNSYGKSGGAIFINQAKLDLTECRFTNNRAETHGGAVRVMRATPTFTDCEFVGNTALLGGGGALDCSYEASPWLEDCTFRQNLSAWGGAIASRGQSDPHVLRGAFYSNRSDGQVAYGGGAVSFFDSRPEYRYSTFYGNRADHGGAIAALPNAPAFLEHCTLTQNAAPEGAGLFSNGAVSVVESSILAFQDGSGIEAVSGAEVQLACSNVHGNSGGDLIGLPADAGDSNDNLSVDPLFCSMEDGLSFNVDVESPVVTDGECGVMGAWLAGCAGDRGVQQPAPELPRVLSIEGVQAAPNPFNPTTHIRFQLESAQHIRAEVYGIDGRRVRMLADQVYTPGWTTLHWNGRDDAGRGVSSGAYVVRLQGEAVTRVQKVLLLK